VGSAPPWAHALIGADLIDNDRATASSIVKREVAFDEALDDLPAPRRS